ncbi:hypothetical protein RFF72_10150, partial [Streptococcus ruminantium]|nr:hypothetical protein [Streptococcus ruminantium]
YNYTPSHNAPRTSYQQTLWQQAQAQRSISNAWEQAKAIGQSVYDWGASRTREAANIARNWTKSLEETITHVCTTAERWVEAGVNFLRNVDWKAVGITAAATVVAVAATAATAGAAAPVIAGVVGAGGLGLTGATATVTTGMAVGAVSGAVGGGSYAFTSGVLSGKQAGSIVKDVGSSILGGATTGLFTGGLLSGLGGATSGIGNALGRQAADTVIETAVDTVVDAAQGGNISPASIGTSLAINAITEGVSSKTVKGQKGDIDVKTSKTKIKFKYDDVYNYEYSAYLNPGPLNDILGQPNRNFYGGRYNSIILEEPVILYRAGNSSRPLGQWFTVTPPQSSIGVRIDTAVKPQWIDRNGFLIGTSPK